MTTERTNGGNWFASAKDGTPLGAFPTRAEAAEAVRHYELTGEKRRGIRPAFIVGPRPCGQDGAS